MTSLQKAIDRIPDRFVTASHSALLFFERHSPMRWRLILLVLLIPLIISSIVFIWQDYDARKQATVTEVRLKSAQVNAQLEDFVHMVRGASGVFAHSWVEDNLPPVHNVGITDVGQPYLADFVANRPHFSKVHITDVSGLVTDSSDASSIGERIGGEEVFGKAFSTGEFCVSDVMTTSDSESPFVLFIQPLIWEGSSPQGFLVLQSELSIISGILSMDSDFPQSAKTGIFDSNGIVLAGGGQLEPHPGMLIGNDISNTELWQHVQTRPRAEWFGTGIDGEERIIFFSYPDTTEWITTVAYSQSDIFSPLWARLRSFGITMAVTVAVMIWVGETLIRRERGWVANLESNVEERTSELRETNDQLREQIAQRNRAEEGVLQKNSELQAIFGSFPDVFYWLDSDGIIRDFHEGQGTNESAAKGNVGKKIQDVFQDDVAFRLRLAIHEAMNENHAVSVEYSIPNGAELHYYEARISPVRGDQVIAIVRDISERKKLESQLIQSHRMQALGQMAGGVAHDFNNVMTVIINYNKLAMMNLQTEEDVNFYLEQVEKGGERAVNLTRQLLAFSRRQVIEPAIVDPGSMVSDMTDMLDSLLHDDIELDIEVAPEIGKINIDPGQFEQVIVNLCINARDAMPNGGLLKIKASNVDLDVELPNYHHNVPAGSYVALSVSDTGGGISDGILPHIFEPFFTTKEIGKGTGLGLSTCYGVVTQSGGYLTVDNQLDGGAIFTIYLPRADGAVSSIVGSNGMQAMPHGSETILLVEDEPSVRSVASTVLRDLGYTVIEASNGVEALRIAQQFQGRHIDLLITDVVMPVMGGVNLVEQFVSLHSDTGILFISGYTDDDIGQIAQLRESTDFLQKPFTLEVFANKVRRVLDRVSADGQKART